MAEPTDWSKYEGKTGTYNGQRIIVRGGVPVPLTRFQPSATHPQPVEDALAAQRGSAQSARAVREMGDQFLGYNQKAGTGGIGTELGSGFEAMGLNIIPPLDRRPERQAMEGLTSKMLSATMIPGTSRSMDSNAEMKMALGRLPNVHTKGPVNADRVTELRRNEAVQAARLRAMEAWASTHQSMDGFEDLWAPQEAQIRKTYGLNVRPPGVPPQAVFDPRTRRWKMP